MKDEGRGRVVTLYAIVGEPEVVGLCDGTDTWVGSAINFGKDVQSELAAVHRGEVREIEQGQSGRRLLDATGVMGYPATDSMPVGAPKPRVMAKARVMAQAKPRIAARGAA